VSTLNPDEEVEIAVDNCHYKGQSLAEVLIEKLDLEYGLNSVTLPLQVLSPLGRCSRLVFGTVNGVRILRCAFTQEFYDPIAKKPRSSLRYIIQHLNDAHYLTFLQIADVIEELAAKHNLDLTIN